MAPNVCRKTSEDHFFGGHTKNRSAKFAQLFAQVWENLGNILHPQNFLAPTPMLLLLPKIKSDYGCFFHKILTPAPKKLHIPAGSRLRRAGSVAISGVHEQTCYCSILGNIKTDDPTLWSRTWLVCWPKLAWLPQQPVPTLSWDMVGWVLVENTFFMFKFTICSDNVQKIRKFH